jgi:hypothetical protein
VKGFFQMYDSRNKTIRIVSDLRIPTGMIAGASEISAPRISDYLRKRRALPFDVESRIEQTITDIALVWRVFAPFRIDLSTSELLASAVQSARETELARIDASIKEITTGVGAENAK